MVSVQLSCRFFSGIKTRWCVNIYLYSMWLMTALTESLGWPPRHHVIYCIITKYWLFISMFWTAVPVAGLKQNPVEHRNPFCIVILNWKMLIVQSFIFIHFLICIYFPFFQSESLKPIDMSEAVSFIYLFPFFILFFLFSLFFLNTQS